MVERKAMQSGFFRVEVGRTAVGAERTLHETSETRMFAGTSPSITRRQLVALGRIMSRGSSAIQV